MPRRLARPCSSPRCPNLVDREHPCPVHGRVLRAEHELTRHQRGYTNTWHRIVQRAIAEQPWCTWCHAPGDLTGDHIVPLSKGGQSTADNCRVLCRPCNSRRGNRG